MQDIVVLSISIISYLVNEIIKSNKIGLKLYYLVAIFACVAIMLHKIGLSLAGILYIIVYSTGVSILFIFVIMMIEIKERKKEKKKEIIKNKIMFNVTLLSITGFALNYNVNFNYVICMYYNDSWDITANNLITAIGYVLYTKYAILTTLLAWIIWMVLIYIVLFISFKIKP